MRTGVAEYFAPPEAGLNFIVWSILRLLESAVAVEAGIMMARILELYVAVDKMLGLLARLKRHGLAAGSRKKGYLKGKTVRKFMRRGAKGTKVLVTGGSGFIGTNLLERFCRERMPVRNLDLLPPLAVHQGRFWRGCDVQDETALLAQFEEFRPSWVIHLAARADTFVKRLGDRGYGVNIEGTRSVLRVVRNCPSVERLIMTSSQFVCGPGHSPSHLRDYSPHTEYGRSKVEMEQVTLEMNPQCCWTLVRPTNVWGPWHMRYRSEFWKVLMNGWYFHPSGLSPVRSYGFVGNVVEQMIRILQAPAEDVHGEIFYLGDQPVELHQWVNGFSRAFTGKDVRVIPIWVLRVAACFGDLVSFVIRKPFYITSSRLESMTRDYIAPMERTFAVLGENPYSLEAGIAETVEWLNAFGTEKWLLKNGVRED